jgi:hypothetical protein
MADRASGVLGSVAPLAARVFGWRVTPPQGSGAEKVELFISGGDVQ